MGQVVAQLIENPKTGQAVAAATAATGAATWIDYIPDDIGKIATLVGIVLSIVVIWATLQREKRERNRAELQGLKIELENQKLLFDLEDRRRLAAERHRDGLPTRRAEDKPADSADRPEND